MFLVWRAILLAAIVMLGACTKVNSQVAVDHPTVADPVSKLVATSTTAALPHGPRVVFPRAAIERLEADGGRVCAYRLSSRPPPCSEILQIVDVGGVDFSGADELGRLHNVRVEGVLVNGQIESVTVASVSEDTDSYVVSGCNPGSGAEPSAGSVVILDPDSVAVPVAHRPWGVLVDTDRVVIIAPLSDSATRMAWCGSSQRLEIRSYGSIDD